MESLTFDEHPALRESVLLVAFAGWSDAGAAATTAVQYLASQLGAKKFATIDGEEFFDFTVQRPIVRLDDQQIRNLVWPGYEFSFAGNMVLAVGPEPHLRWKTFSRLVLRLAQEVGIARIALPGAFLADVPYGDPVPLTGFASDPALLEKLKIAPTAYQGPTGIVGTLADAFRRESFPLLSLWAAIPHYIANTPNPRGALALVLKLKEWIDLPIDLGPLEAAAASFQQQLLEAVESDSDLGKYLRALKKGETSH